MILVDTSAWIEFLRGTGGELHGRLEDLIREEAQLGTTDPVIMELMAGAADESRVRQLRRFLARFEHLPTAGLVDFEGAASLYRACRREAATIRSLTDCLIAAVAIRTGAQVLSADRDFEVLAQHTELTLAT